MNLFPMPNPPCGCTADVTAATAVLPVRRGRPHRLPDDWRDRIAIAKREMRRARQIHHFRSTDQARWWHWSDQEVIAP